MADLSFARKLRIVNLKDEQGLSYRQLEDKVGVPKSTIHDNMVKYREEADAFHAAVGIDPVERLVRAALIVSMNGKCSLRDTASVISAIWGIMVSHQTILKILEIASNVASELNGKIDLGPVQSALFDEIFQKLLPLLVFVDANSGVIMIRNAPDRTGDSWKEFLEYLKTLGLDPETVATDGGSGLLKGIGEVFGSATLVRDLYHVLQKLSKATRSMEASCYRFLAIAYAFEKKGDLDKAKEALVRFDQAATLFERYEEQLREFKLSSHLDHPESERGYIDSKSLLSIVLSLHETLAKFVTNFSDHRAIKEAQSYLKNGSLEIVAYKKKISTLVENAFGGQYKEMILEHLCPLIEYINQFLRSHDSVARQAFWGKKIADLRHRFRAYSIVDQEEIDSAINMVWAIGLKSCKSNSLVESVNRVIRAYLKTYKSIPSWFCSLFTFFRNNHTFSRGKRAKSSPMELLTGKIQKSNWLDEIIEKFPLEKLRSSLPAIPGLFNPEWDRANRRPSPRIEKIADLRAVG